MQDENSKEQDSLKPANEQSFIQEPQNQQEQQTPSQTTQNPEQTTIEFEYVGFWIRVVASLIDTVIMTLIIVPILLSYYGIEYIQDTSFLKGPVDFLMNYIFPAIAVITLWVCKQSTPGKMAFSAKIVDAKTFGKPTIAQSIIRYLGYFVSTFPLCLGLIWVAFDAKKRGWHDMMAGTLVIIEKPRRK